MSQTIESTLKVKGYIVVITHENEADDNHQWKNRRIKNSYLAIDINKWFKETCEKLLEKFKVQIEEEFTNEWNKCGVRIKQLDWQSDTWKKNS